jgi:hypothetical protein
MRLLHTVPLSRVVAQARAEAQQAYNVSHAHVMLTKTAGKALTTHALSGELYASKSGWLLLSVPNALVRGAFDALNETGVELPPQHDGKLNAHISVMRPEELEQIGGIDKITERGHHFNYTLGPVQETRPSGWGEMAKVWFIQVKSTDLQNLRKSYGLSPRPNGNKYDFHITIAVRRKKVLQQNDVAKAASLLLPALRLANRMLDEAPAAPDQADVVSADDSYLAPLAQLRVQTPRRQRVPVALSSILTGANTNGMRLRKKKAEVSPTDGETEAGSATIVPAVQAEAQEEDFDCGPAALKGIYDYYGIQESLDAVSDDTGADPAGGTEPGRIADDARKHGLNVAAQHFTIDELRDHLDQGHLLQRSSHT